MKKRTYMIYRVIAQSGEETYYENLSDAIKATMDNPTSKMETLPLF